MRFIVMLIVIVCLLLPLCFMGCSGACPEGLIEYTKCFTTDGTLVCEGYKSANTSSRYGSIYCIRLCVKDRRGERR